MKHAALILSMLWLAGCVAEKRSMQRCRVVDVADERPIVGAKVWVQPYCPVLPNWPWGDKGVTDEAGEVRLSLPSGFWFYFSGAHVAGYKTADNPPRYEDRVHGQEDFIFYLQRVAARKME